MLTSHREGEPVDSLAPVLDCEQVSALQAAVRQVTVEDSINQYVLDIVEATRRCDELHVGVSTRGALALYRAAQAAALVAGRRFAVPDDVKQLTVPVLAHRVIPKGYLHGGDREAIESFDRAAGRRRARAGVVGELSNEPFSRRTCSPRGRKHRRPLRGEQVRRLNDRCKGGYAQFVRDGTKLSPRTKFRCSTNFGQR